MPLAKLITNLLSRQRKYNELIEYNCFNISEQQST